ncbi:MAG: hypothetical protein RLN78_12510 [Phycisphaerales bacterium]
MSDDMIGTCGLFVVGFYDILGQSSSFNAWSSIEELTTKGSPAWTAMLKSISMVEAVREDFNEFYEGYRSVPVNEIPDSCTEVAKKYPKITSFVSSIQLRDIGRMSFSDTNIWFVPFGDKSSGYSTREIALMMLAIASAHVLALQRGVICRGALTIGCGADILGVKEGRGEIYGPVLLDAYRLESEASDYPRVIISDSIYKMIRDTIVDTDGMEMDSVEFASANYNNTNLDLMWDFLYQDTDGAFALDYAGERVAEIFSADEKLSTNDIFTDMYNNIQKMMNDAGNKRNFKHLRRLKLVADYLDSRKQFWLNSQPGATA